MTPKFESKQAVRFSDFIIASCPKYAGRVYEIVHAIRTDWEIGHTEWMGEYSIRGPEGHVSVTYESCLVAL